MSFDRAQQMNAILRGEIATKAMPRAPRAMQHLVLLVLVSVADETGIVCEEDSPSMAEMVSWHGIDDRTLRAVIEALREQNLLGYLQPNGRARVYHLAPPFPARAPSPTGEPPQRLPLPHRGAPSPCRMGSGRRRSTSLGGGWFARTPPPAEIPRRGGDERICAEWGGRGGYLCTRCSERSSSCCVCSENARREPRKVVRTHTHGERVARGRGW